VTDPACYRVGLEHYPGFNPFVLDWLRGDDRFLPRGDRPRLKRTPSPELVRALAESNRRWGIDAGEELRRWAAGDTFTIVAGQQVGFGGGPLYTIAKLASLLKMKRDYDARGVPTTVFFWLATEDHDFDEVANIAIPIDDPRRQTDLLTLRSPRFAEPKRAVGTEIIPERLIEDLLRAMEIDRPRWLRRDITFGDSFAELLATALPGGKFILIDSLLPELHRDGAPIVKAILDRWSDVQSSIASASAALQAAGYTPQVTPRPGEDAYTLLFRIDDHGNREIVPRREEAGPPERLSMSALTRPLLQDFVLRPDVFVGGPAEVAYFAQIKGVHEILGVPMPRVALRAHALVAPRSLVARFAKYGIRPEEVFGSPESLLTSRERPGVDAIRSIAADAEKQLQSNIEKIRDIALPADHAVARSVNRSIGHIEYHFRKLTERAIRALVRKDRDRFAAVRDLVSALYPDQHVQDRIVAWLPMWLRYGDAFCERLVNEVEPDTDSFKIVSV
jgi:uncharacterized protein YllA (UPF0747 family)